MELFSHNTMSYRKPRSWWMKPIAWIGRCQSKTYREQYEAGARYFDLRLAFDKNGCVWFAHGIFRYDASDIIEVIQWMCAHAKGVRVMLEVDKRARDKQLFINYCAYMLSCGDIFYGGHRKSDGKAIYRPFSWKDTPPVKHLYSSSTAWCSTVPWLDDLCPWLYATMHNATHLTEYSNTDAILGIDFI